MLRLPLLPLAAVKGWTLHKPTFLSFQSEEVFLHMEVHLSSLLPRFDKVGIDQKVGGFLFLRET